MYRRIGLIFALLLTVSCFAQFDNLKIRFTDSTGAIDTAGYSRILNHMWASEDDSRGVHEKLYLLDSSKIELLKITECVENMKLITIEKAKLYGAEIDSTTTADMSESDFNELWLLLLAPPAAGLEWFRRWWKKRKEAKL